MRDAESQLANAILGEHRERRSGVGTGYCVACREKWPCAPFKLASIVLDVTEILAAASVSTPKEET